MVATPLESPKKQESPRIPNVFNDRGWDLWLQNNQDIDDETYTRAIDVVLGYISAAEISRIIMKLRFADKACVASDLHREVAEVYAAQFLERFGIDTEITRH